MSHFATMMLVSGSFGILFVILFILSKIGRGFDEGGSISMIIAGTCSGIAFITAVFISYPLDTFDETFPVKSSEFYLLKLKNGSTILEINPVEKPKFAEFKSTNGTHYLNLEGCIKVNRDEAFDFWYSNRFKFGNSNHLE